MIRRIESLSGFGILRQHVGDRARSVPDFKKFNLIYGWNYSGKTTLSRVFRALEERGLDRQFASAKFRLTLEDGLSIDSSDLSQAPPVRVFNRDFVDSNFRAEHTAPAVFILGEKNAELKARLAQLNWRIGRVTKIGLEASAARSKIESDNQQMGRTRAREIGTLLGVRNFRRPDLERRIGEVRDDAHSHILTDDAASGRHATLRSGEDYSELKMVEYVIPDLSAAADEVNKLLEQTASRRAIDELATDPSLEAWVRQGLGLHRSRTDCGFCGASLTEARLAKLQGHFSTAYEALLSDLQQKAGGLEKMQLNLVLPDDARFLQEVRPGFVKTRKAIEEWFEWARSTRQSLVAELVKKRANIERTTAWAGDLSRADELKRALEDLGSLYIRHNQIVGSIDEARSAARVALERHYSALYFEENEIARRERECLELQERADRASRLRDKIEGQKLEIEVRISAASIGAERLNELLHYLLSGCNIEVQKVGESEFRFLRDGQRAVHLSDGERTAVTLSYFLTSLEAEGLSLRDAIVFVDDPISSLDSNHIYAVYALIVERLSSCMQLFVSTHNSEFFNLLKSEWLGPKGGNKPSSSAYRIFRVVGTDGSSEAQLENLPVLLRRYRSEYEFIFALLYRFLENPSPSEHEAYAAPALLRKFLEAYLGFRKPGIRKWHDKLDLLFEATEMRHEVHKFADEASHLQSLDRSLQHPDFVTSSRRCVKAVIDAVKSKDRGHYESLVSVVEGDPGV